MRARSERTETAARRSRLPVAAPLVALAAFFRLAVCPPALHAQELTVARGRAVIGDSAPLIGARVLLHRVGRDIQGPVDSTRADDRGRFRFRFRPDTSALYLLSVRYGGIEYFSTPVHTNPGRPDTAIRLVACDTSSTAPVAVEAR